MMSDEWIDDKELILNRAKWPGETLCMKRRGKEGEKVGVMGYAAFGVLTNNRAPFIIYIEPNYIKEQKYNSIDEMLADNWMVD